MPSTRLLISLVGIAVITGVFLLILRNPKPEIVTIDNFLDAISARDAIAAFQLLDKSLQRQYGDSMSLLATMDSYEFYPKQWDLRQDISASDAHFGYVTARVTLNDGRTVQMKFRVQRVVRNDYRILAIQFDIN